ncbi:FAD binding domain protein [Pestalotiopsis sp. NC0098]|nr:FAD binding domain protein [Pestalotiopsis sp. NC0098]
MAGSDTFRVVIVGGGVAGLTLANMLEKFDIDYIILESHGDIAPAVGASIGLFPNGLRILDQIDCYERVLALPQRPITILYERNSQGKPFSKLANVSEQLQLRHGYPVLFFDRQWLLKLLYENLQHKNRVALGMKVAKLQPTDGGVQVITKDGQVVEGTIVVGADGVHSTIRDEMFRLGNKLRPGYFPAGEPDRVPCYYRCSFGIAQHVPGYANGELNRIWGEDWSGLTISGPEDRVYWFIFDRLPEPKYGSDIPKYTKEDEAKFAEEFWNKSITDKVTFGQIYSKKSTSTLTPLHEVVWKKWFFERIILLGDSAHKPNPISGQGGNGAMESVAELVNAIVRMRDAKSGSLTGLDDADVETILSQTQSARHEREQYLIAAAHYQQYLGAHENKLISNLFTNVLAPLGGDEMSFSILGKPFIDAARIDKLPIPSRGRLVPFNDELPARPLSAAMGRVATGCFSAGMLSLIWLASKSMRLPAEGLDDWAGLAAISRPWSGLGGGLFKTIMSAFSYPLEGQPPASRVQLIYFMTHLAAPILSYTVDGHRPRNRLYPLSLPSVFLGVMQVLGIGYIAPTHALLEAAQSDTLPTTQSVSLETSEALLPALALGYGLPTALMLAPGFGNTAKQNITAIWQFSPLYVPALTSLWRRYIGRRASRTQLSATEKDKASPPRKDAAKATQALKRVYLCTAAVQAAVHLATMAYACLGKDMSVADIFFHVPSPFAATWNLPDTGSQIATFLKYDFGIASCAWLMSGLYSTWDLRRRGYVTTTEGAKAAVGICLGQFLVGPGATSMLSAYWQEVVFDRLRSRK